MLSLARCMVWEQLLPHTLPTHWTEGSSWFHNMHTSLGEDLIIIQFLKLLFCFCLRTHMLFFYICLLNFQLLTLFMFLSSFIVTKMEIINYFGGWQVVA